jgi:hypothetical protein
MPRAYSPIKLWFNYPDDPCGGRIEVRHLSPREEEEIREKESPTKQILDDHGVRVESSKRTMHEEIELAVAAVVGWENFLDADGDQMACTARNVRRAAMQFDDFLLFVAECREKLATKVATDKEARIKN